MKTIEGLNQIIRIQRYLLKKGDFVAFMVCQRCFHLTLAEM